MTAVVLLDAAPAGTVPTPILAVSPSSLEKTIAGRSPVARAWVAATGFSGKEGSVALLAGSDGTVAEALFGLGETEDRNPFAAGALAAALPVGTYRLADGFPNPALAALAIALGGYDYARFRARKDGEIRLLVPQGVDGAELRRQVAAATLARDLINTPANRMGPADLAAAVRQVAEGGGASFAETGGDALKTGFPLIHAVGAGAGPGREPRLLDLVWGDPSAPKVTLVGKGVCFDTGGLDIKPSSNMLLMKKDMGGAANALALATLVMGAGLPIRLRVLIPAVENAISGNAYRPGDILESRKGFSVEIGNTDAEGRLILADALTLASEEAPDLLIDFATLTGAARVALGPDLPAIFTRDDALAADLAACAEATADPSWRLPLWPPYMAMLDSKTADINNAGQGGFAGAITAALFLSRFVGDGLTWLHADIFAWNPKSSPGRPEGGEVQTMRALHELLKRRYGSAPAGR